MRSTKGKGDLPVAPATQLDRTDHPKPSVNRRSASCRAHCRGCGRCFASVDAFDAHRAGHFSAPLASLEGRHCGSPEHDERFETALGVCRVDPEARGVALWRLAADAERARRRFAADPSPPALAVAA